MEVERLDMMNVDIAELVLVEMHERFHDKYTRAFADEQDVSRLAMAIQHARESVNEKYKAVE